jgi:hypothetical protein
LDRTGQASRRADSTEGKTQPTAKLNAEAEALVLTLIGSSGFDDLRLSIQAVVDEVFPAA